MEEVAEASDDQATLANYLRCVAVTPTDGNGGVHQLCPQSEPEHRMRRRTQDGARRFEQQFEEAVNSRKLSVEHLFDASYQRIEGSHPSQYHTHYEAFTDQVAPSIQEPLLQSDGRVRGACLHARNGYRPTMNLSFSNPQGGDPSWNAKHARTETIITATPASTPLGTPMGSHGDLDGVGWPGIRSAVLTQTKGWQSSFQ